MTETEAYLQRHLVVELEEPHHHSPLNARQRAPPRSRDTSPFEPQRSFRSETTPASHPQGATRVKTHIGKDPVWTVYS